VPIRTVLFTQLCKFDGENVIILKVRDFRQIAGRAGRAGFDTVGYVVAQAPAHVIENARVDERVTDPKKRKKIVKAQPPTRGYKHWDETTFQQLVERPPEALVGRFTVDHGRLLSLMQHAADTSGDAYDGYEQLLALIRESHATAAEKVKLEAQAATLLESLRHAGVVGQDGERTILDPALQRDFSLHHSLSLFLLDALATLEPGAPTHALDVVSWVEAILENPRAVLERQQDRERTRVLNELKAAGVPYEDRIVALEEVTYPKPNAEAIYEFFNAYADKHPWVDGEGIRPKGVVREMVESLISFSDHVKDLGLQRSEGVLLRYVTDVYKALVQNVPPEHQTEALADVIGYLRAMLGLVDSSLLTEWEKLVRGDDAPDAEQRPIDISADRKTFHARVRAELHAFVRQLAQGDWEEAAQCVRRAEDGPWGAEELAAALAPFLEERGGVAFDHRTRLATSTVIKPDGAHRWIVRQTLFPVRGEEAADTWGYDNPDDAGVDADTWVIEGRVDLRGDTNPEGPLVALERIGA
jgi:hypothetical protein